MIGHDIWWLRRKTHVSDVTNVSIGVVSLMECSQGPLLVVCGRGASHVKNGANGEDFRPKVSFPQRTSGYNLKGSPLPISRADGAH